MGRTSKAQGNTVMWVARFLLLRHLQLVFIYEFQLALTADKRKNWTKKEKETKRNEMPDSGAPL